MECGVNLSVNIKEGELRRTPEVLDVYIIKGADPEVRSDFSEAQKCYNVEAYKAAVVMCRRALEGMTCSMGAEGRTLIEKMEDIYQKGLISKRNLDIATKVRLFGNIGAHLKNDLLGGIKENDARGVLDITLHLLRDVYEVPVSIERLRERLEE